MTPEDRDQALLRRVKALLDEAARMAARNQELIARLFSRDRRIGPPRPGNEKRDDDRANAG